jgi:hypothetical protein
LSGFEEQDETKSKENNEFYRRERQCSFSRIELRLLLS